MIQKSLYSELSLWGHLSNFYGDPFFNGRKEKDVIRRLLYTVFIIRTSYNIRMPLY